MHIELAVSPEDIVRHNGKFSVSTLEDWLDSAFGLPESIDYQTIRSIFILSKSDSGVIFNTVDYGI